MCLQRAVRLISRGGGGFCSCLRAWAGCTTLTISWYIGRWQISGSAARSLVARRRSGGCLLRWHSAWRTVWLAVVEEVGYTTQGIAAQVLCGLFGRDEDGSEFTFTQEHIDMLFTSGLSP